MGQPFPPPGGVLLKLPAVRKSSAYLFTKGSGFFSVLRKRSVQEVRVGRRERQGRRIRGVADITGAQAPAVHTRVELAQHLGFQAESISGPHMT